MNSTGGATGAGGDPELPGRAVSPWLDRRPAATRPALDHDLEVDVVVAGAGIVGLTAALLAARDGARVAVLERRRVGAGVSGNTTAKVTWLHGLVYSSLISRHGPEAARAYAEANEAGLATVVALAESLGIDCDLRRKAHLVYAERPAERDAVEREAEAAAGAGLEVDVVPEAGLPFATAGAIRARDQAELDPVAYLEGLAAELDRDGPRIYERTAVVGLTGDGVATAGGLRVRAGHVIVATQLPFADRGLLFARAKPSRSYALTARLEGPPPPEMYLSASSQPHSIRSLRHGREQLALVAGEGEPFARGEPVERLRALAGWARERLGAVAVEHRWSAHDYVPEDLLPYVGRLRPGSDRVLTATGLSKWGLAMGTTAARMMVDTAGGRRSRWSEAFDPWRLPGRRSIRPLAEHNLSAGAHFVADRLRRRSGADELEPGEGRVVGAGPGRRAVYRDPAGELHAVSARCTHLGCLVRWNGAERTWECPCHGSRFGALGEVLNGPAVDPLEPREPPAAQGG
ncbi:MAG TPA: FAD-dependent oxidoreductase [Solirubrobacterales bacterium]|nr:FAD-dependent oxidoreductase [Solirubrobacterales bacterium]